MTPWHVRLYLVLLVGLMVLERLGADPLLVFGLASVATWLLVWLVGWVVC